MGRKKIYRLYHIFDIYKNYLGVYDEINLCKKLKISPKSINSTIKRKSCVGNYYYISSTKDFEFPKPKAYSHNPLLSNKMKRIERKGNFYAPINLDFIFEYEIGIFQKPLF